MDIMPMMATETVVTKIKEVQLYPRSSCKKIYINHYVENIVFMGALKGSNNVYSSEKPGDHPIIITYRLGLWN